MNIVIVGGGTAGTLSALFCQRYFPKEKIYLIDSSDIGIIGVGESTTPPLVELLEFLGITLADMITHCGATIKNATRFTNWNGDNTFYHHGFNTDPELDIFYGSHKSFYSSNNITWPAHKPLLALANMQERKNLDSVHFSGVLSIENKVPWSFDSNNQMKNHASVGLHFDARKAAEYFKDLAIKRGVINIDAKVLESRLAEDGNVVSLKLDSNQEIECDFIFDCSGFFRMFVEKTYNSKFVSFNKFLPVNEAIPFFVSREGETPTFTEAIALSSGWMWKTPVNGRFGCGYVYDNDYINKDQAFQEVSKLLGFEPEINRTLKFESGYFETPWNKNVLAVGLSSGFLEPLEATSIWITIISLHLLVEHISGLVNRDEKSIKEYNKEFTRSVNSILGLVQFHYFTKRKDSKFWQEFREKNTTSPVLENVLELYSYRLPSNIESYTYNAFPSFSWFLVGAGIDYFSEKVVNDEVRAYNVDYALTDKNRKQFRQTFDSIISKCINHNEFLNTLRYEK